MQARRPNVVICLCDQLRPFEVGCYGNSVVQTPNMDRLAAHGVRFETACSNSPLCSPARSVLLSGQYSRTSIGTLKNADEPVSQRSCFPDTTIAEAFSSAGYTTGLIGKWHIDPDPTLLGFDYTMRPFFHHRYTGQTYFDSTGGSVLVDGFIDDYEQRVLRDWIGKHKDEKFFLFYNISQPHMPLMDAPERYRTMYSRDDVQLRDNTLIDGKIAHDEEWFKIYSWDFLYYDQHLPHTTNLPDSFDLVDLTALYYGMVTWTDDQLGGLVRTLEENGLTDDTIILFISDHGDCLGSQHMFNKGNLYDEAVRIPMIWSWPGRVEPRVISSQVASLVDVMPTMLSLTGLETLPEVQGTDLTPVIMGDVESTGENVAFIETHQLEIGVRSLTHLYGISMVEEGIGGRLAVQDDGCRFYDMLTDPFQLNDLLQTDQQSDTAMQLRSSLLKWDRETPWRFSSQRKT